MLKNLLKIIILALSIVNSPLTIDRCQAQTFAQMKLWDSHGRAPQIWAVEFDGTDSLLATYDAIYGHGAMLENNTYALRVYASPWPRTDLYAKGKRGGVELSATHFYTTAQQRAQGYGCDVLIVGDRMGVGSLLGWDGQQPLPLNPVERRGQRVLRCGPDTAQVEAYVTGWDYHGRCINLRQRFTMTASDPWTTVDVWVEGAADDTPFLTGIQHLHARQGHTIAPTGLMAHTWGNENPEEGVHAKINLFIDVEPQYHTQTIDQKESVWMVVHPVQGHLRYRVRAVCVLQNEEKTETP